MNKKPPVLALLLSLLANETALSQVDRSHSASPVSTQMPLVASCVIQMDFDANRGSRADSQMLTSLLSSTELVDPAVKEALNLSSSQWPAVAQIDPVPAGSYAVRLGVTISRSSTTLPLPDDAAHKLLAALTERATRAVNQIGAAQEKAAADRAAALEKDQQAAKIRLDAASAKLRDAQVDDGQPYRNIPIGWTDAAALDAQTRQLQSKLKLLEEEADRLKSAVTTRPSSAAWDQAIELKQSLLEQMRSQNEGGAATKIETEKIAADLAVTQALAASLAEGRLDPFERVRTEIEQTRITLIDIESRRSTLDPAASQPHRLSNDEINDLRQEQSQARNQLSSISQQLDQVHREQQSSAGRVRLIVLNGALP